MTRIYTRSGDDGSSGLIGGKRVSKHSLRLEAYGTVDELNAFLGQAIAEGASVRLRSWLSRIQHHLFDLGAELATEGESTPPRIQKSWVQQMEQWIDELTDDLPPLTQFILPGGSLCASTLHVARTVCRRAERRTIALREQEFVNPIAIHYLNRLSDLLFVMARFQNQSETIHDIPWQSQPE